MVALACFSMVSSSLSPSVLSPTSESAAGIKPALDNGEPLCWGGCGFSFSGLSSVETLTWNGFLAIGVAGRRLILPEGVTASLGCLDSSYGDRMFFLGFPVLAVLAGDGGVALGEGVDLVLGVFLVFGVVV